MAKFKLTKEGALALFFQVTGWEGLLYNHDYHIYKCDHGYVITVINSKKIPVDRVLVRYDTKMFRNRECIYEGSYE
jgi:hypothetical protein